MAGVPGTGLRAGDTEKKKQPRVLKDTEQWRQTGRRRFQSSVVPADKATAGGMRAQTQGLMEELLKLKNQKQNQKPTAGEPANSLMMTGTLCLSIFIGLVRMEASVTRIVVVSDILTGLILLSCPPSTPPVTFSKVGTVTYMKKWKPALAEASCLLQDNISSVELCSSCLGHHLPESHQEVASCLW